MLTFLNTELHMAWGTQTCTAQFHRHCHLRFLFWPGPGLFGLLPLQLVHPHVVCRCSLSTNEGQMHGFIVRTSSITDLLFT